MSRSNPMHHAAAKPAQPAAKPTKRPIWPFPASLLDYPTLPPDARPVRTPVAPPVGMPDALI